MFTGIFYEYAYYTCYIKYCEKLALAALKLALALDYIGIS